MIFESFSPRQLGLVGLLGLVPTIGYAIGRPDYWAFVAAFNVVLIVGSLYLATAPIENGHDAHDEASA